MINVDGDTSPNDSVMILANGMAKNPKITKEDANFKLFQEALDKTALFLAKKIVEDGEGATKFITVKVKGAKTSEDAKNAALSVAKSNLVKAAFFGEDPNWGRIVTALGYSSCSIIPEKMCIWINEILVFKNGEPSFFDQTKLASTLKKREITIKVKLNIGNFESTAYTCDLTPEYVKLNSLYQT
jgi:glutamate N-acetyltransferase/amino-acid N-acetyltransferase